MTTDLSDVTFMIPIKIDSEDRITNLNIVTTYIREHFNTNIIIAEQDIVGSIPNILGKSLYNAYIHYKENGKFFYKTRLVNLMTKYAKTPFVAMCDSDVLCKPDQYVSAVNKLRKNQVDFIYPFNGRCVNIPIHQIPKVMEELKFDFIRVKYTNSKSLAMGGCVIYNRNKFIHGGMMNENFISYGPEDGEQDLRLKKLGFRSDRINQPLWHLNHARTFNSCDGHMYHKQNWTEFKKIKRMSTKDLRAYVESWPWTKS